MLEIIQNINLYSLLAKIVKIYTPLTPKRLQYQGISLNFSFNFKFLTSAIKATN